MTCSAKNFEVCKKLGASVFDHHSENVIEELTAALKEKGECGGAYVGILELAIYEDDSH
jgi:hypothetical protein